MAAADKRPETVRAIEADAPEPPRDEAARARGYLDLWERHLTLSAIDGPILPGRRSPA